jgi:hypothetical protein
MRLPKSNLEHMASNDMRTPQALLAAFFFPAGGGLAVQVR